LTSRIRNNGGGAIAGRAPNGVGAKFSPNVAKKTTLGEQGEKGQGHPRAMYPYTLDPKTTRDRPVKK